MSAPGPSIIRGRLSPHEREQIESLALRNLKAAAIATRLNRHPATINFAMHSAGLKAPADRSGVTYTRKDGSKVNSFTPDEDEMVEEMRTAGAVCREIAEACRERFGRRRTPATINTRLMMLANKDEGQ